MSLVHLLPADPTISHWERQVKTTLRTVNFPSTRPEDSKTVASVSQQGTNWHQIQGSHIAEEPRVFNKRANYKTAFVLGMSPKVWQMVAGTWHPKKEERDMNFSTTSHTTQYCESTDVRCPARQTHQDRKQITNYLSQGKNADCLLKHTKFCVLIVQNTPFHYDYFQTFFAV